MTWVINDRIVIFGWSIPLRMFRYFYWKTRHKYWGRKSFLQCGSNITPFRNLRLKNCNSRPLECFLSRWWWSALTASCCWEGFVSPRRPRRCCPASLVRRPCSDPECDNQIWDRSCSDACNHPAAASSSPAPSGSPQDRPETSNIPFLKNHRETAMIEIYEVIGMF